MAINSEIHPIQSALLVALLYKSKARFTELNKLEVPSDQFNFHLKLLLSIGLIKKSGDGFYGLTNAGKEFANRFDTENKIIERQAKISILVHCTKEVKGTAYYLMQERLKEPYFGFLGAISGKVRWGDTARDTAVRELKEETNLAGEPKFIGIEHKIDYDKSGNLLEDKFFYIFSVKDPVGSMRTETLDGKNKWMTKAEIFSSGKTFDDLNDVFGIIESKKIGFIEKRYKVSKY